MWNLISHWGYSSNDLIMKIFQCFNSDKYVYEHNLPVYITRLLQSLRTEMSTSPPPVFLFRLQWFCMCWSTFGPIWQSSLHLVKVNDQQFLERICLNLGSLTNKASKRSRMSLAFPSVGLFQNWNIKWIAVWPLKNGWHFFNNLLSKSA